MDFCNTLERAGDDPQRDWLDGYSQLVKWSIRAGATSDAEGLHLARASRRNPKRTATDLQRALQLRLAIRATFTHIALDTRTLASDLELINRALSRALSRRHVAPSRSGGGYRWAWSSEGDELDRPLWPIALSAAELLTSDAVQRVRKCASAECGWLFVDDSRNHNRRWCEMEVCGNRSKARDHYRRAHSSGGKL